MFGIEDNIIESCHLMCYQGSTVYLRQARQRYHRPTAAVRSLLPPYSIFQFKTAVGFNSPVPKVSTKNE